MKQRNGRPRTLPTIQVPATRAEYDMYNRYTTYFHSGRSPYGGAAPLPFDAWMNLVPSVRPGGPATEPSRSDHMCWGAGDIVWER